MFTSLFLTFMNYYTQSYGGGERVLKIRRPGQVLMVKLAHTVAFTISMT